MAVLDSYTYGSGTVQLVLDLTSHSESSLGVTLSLHLDHIRFSSSKSRTWKITANKGSGSTSGSFTASGDDYNASGTTKNKTLGSTTITGLSANSDVTFTCSADLSGMSGLSGLGTLSGSVTFTTDKPSVTTPTLSGLSISSVGSDSAYLSFSVTNNGGASIVDSYIDVATNSSIGNIVKTITSSAGTASGLDHYTTYYARGNASNGTYRGYTSVSSFTTGGSKPSVTSVTTSPSRTGCTFNVKYSIDSKDTYTGMSIRYGTSTSYGSSTSSTSISGLSPNTRYYYSITVSGSKGGTSGAYTGSFVTTCNSPSSLSMSRTSSTTSSIAVRVSASGDTNASITNYTVYYRSGSSGSYSSRSLGTSTSATISSLSTDTNYQFYFTATNAGGTTTSSTYTYSTTLGNPSITTPTVSNLLPFSCTIKATGSISPSRTLQYRFSKDGSTWTSYQNSNSYNWTGLEEEKIYNMRVQVKTTSVGVNALDTTATSSLSVTTPADIAKIHIKVNNVYKKGKAYFKYNGQWVKAKKIYIKVNGVWKLNDNDNIH